MASGLAGEGFATALAGGDLDGDGWPEIVVGAPSALGSGSSRPGVVRVFRGGPATFASSDPTPWLIFTGELNGERFGESIAVVDLSGDGLGDLVVGAPQSARSGASSGAVFVFFGRSDLASKTREGSGARARCSGGRPCTL